MRSNHNRRTKLLIMSYLFLIVFRIVRRPKRRQLKTQQQLLSIRSLKSNRWAKTWTTYWQAQRKRRIVSCHSSTWCKFLVLTRKRLFKREKMKNLKDFCRRRGKSHQDKGSRFLPKKGQHCLLWSMVVKSINSAQRIQLCPMLQVKSTWSNGSHFLWGSENFMKTWARATFPIMMLWAGMEDCPQWIGRHRHRPNVRKVCW